MPNYIDSSFNQSKFIPIVLSQQIMPGTFEHTISLLVEDFLDMSVFESRYKNDDTGRPAYDPAMLLRVILTAYSRGCTSSRRIQMLCEQNTVFMALSGDTQPHFTTLARFISQMSDVIQGMYTKVLLVCSQEGLIGSNMFAIDGCKLPSNASKEWSGTHAELTKKHKKMSRAVRRVLKKHREEDASGAVNDDIQREAEDKNIATLRKSAKKVKQFCNTNVDRAGIKGKVVKSNITDNESAKMKTSHGTLQGYNGVAAVDDKHQIVVAAEAYGQGPENNLLIPMIEQVGENMGVDYIAATKVTADSGFHSKDNIKYCQDEGIDAYIADGNYRKRDPRFKARDRYQPKARKAQFFKAADFDYSASNDACICPAGKTMWRQSTRQIDGNDYVTFSGFLKDCRSCPLLKQCMRKPIKSQGRQVSIKVNSGDNKLPSPVEKMKTKIDSSAGRHVYSRRLGTVEPVFGNINTAKGLSRFSLRGKEKVNAQWLMYCLVHNVEKIQRYGNIA